LAQLPSTLLCIFNITFQFVWLSSLTHSKMSFLRAAVFALACFGSLLSGASAAGFSAQLQQPSGSVALANGANSVNTGASWSTTALAGFTDGQFQADGGYIVPVGGTYHFDTTMTVEVNTISAPDQTVHVRIVKCANGCNALCSGNTAVAATLIQSGTFYLDTGFSAAFPPTYAISAAFTGYFNTGDLIAVCIDNSATSGAVRLLCEPNTCAFSGFST
jgi:hypothetical protein